MKISNIYKLASNPGTIFMLVCAILSLSITTPSFAVTGNSRTNTADLRDHSGEDLFKAIFLLQGELVNDIPTLRDLKRELGEYTNSGADEMFALMRANHSGYFSELEEAVNSNDHYQIQESLEKGAELVLISQYTSILLSKANEIENMPDLTRYDMNIDSDREAALRDITEFFAREFGLEIEPARGYVVIGFILAVVVAFVAVIASVVVWVDEHKPAPSDPPINTILDEGKISKDKIIADLVAL